MDLNEIAAQQIKMDELNGFPVRFSTLREKFDQLTKDLVGLFGEIGEFSNVVKKINIKLDRGDDYSLDVPDAEAFLREELVDCFIYIIRIGAILDIDLQAELLKKMEVNAIRYEQLHRK